MDAGHLLCRLEAQSRELGAAAGTLMGVAGMLDAARCKLKDTTDPEEIDGDLAAIIKVVEGLAARCRGGPIDQ